MSNESWQVLAREAWTHRTRAFVIGNTRVGAAALCADGSVFCGCNVEHRFRCHDVHAEVNVITSMVAGGHTDLVAIMIVAERERFTPCGGCMDWIFQFGGAECLVAYQSKADGPINTFKAAELMPHYPK